jgi:hypothetical protein
MAPTAAGPPRRRRTGDDVRMQAIPVATFRDLDEAESALDWIGVDVAEGDGVFTGELRGDDRDLLAAALEDPDTPGPVRDLARALLAGWDADGGPSFAFVVAWAG